MLATGATTPLAPGGAQEGGRRQTEGGDKPPSLAGSRRCSWAFRQDRARMSSPGRGREGADSPPKLLLIFPSELEPLFAWSSLEFHPAAGHFTFETQAQGVKAGMACRNPLPDHELGGLDQEPATGAKGLGPL